MADSLQRTLCVVPKVFAFRVPPAGAAGHRASAWPKEAMWSGRLRVVQNGSKLTVQLEHLDKTGLFASCPVTSDRTVEPVTDSSRYFVLRIEDGSGRHAFVGIGFNSRDEAFEFKVALQDNTGSSQDKQRAEEYLNSLPDQDFALPADGMIKVNLSKKAGDDKKKKKKKKKAEAAAAAGGGAGAFALAPPPKKGEKRADKKKGKSKKAAAAAPDGGVADVLDLASSFGGLGVDNSAAAAAPAAANDDFDPFADPSGGDGKAANGGGGGGGDDWVAF